MKSEVLVFCAPVAAFLFFFLAAAATAADDVDQRKVTEGKMHIEKALGNI